MEMAEDSHGTRGTVNAEGLFRQLYLLLCKAFLDSYKISQKKKTSL